jgi:hypothetical protein
MFGRISVRLSVLAIAGFALLSGCGSGVKVSQTNAKNPTSVVGGASVPRVEFYFYLNSDSDILGTRPDGTIDNQGEILYDQLKSLATTEGFGLHIYLDRGQAYRAGDPTDSETYDRCAGEPAVKKLLGETDSVDPKYIADLVAKNCYADAKRFIILWSHGDGFRVQDDFDYNPGDHAFHISTLLSAIPDGFAEAILFDSCAMADLEIAALVEKKAKWMVASQYELPNIGIQYAGLPASLAKSRDTVSILSGLRTDSEKAFAEIEMRAPLALLDLSKIEAVRVAFIAAWAAAATDRAKDYLAFRASVLRDRDADLFYLFGAYSPASKAVLAAALESGRGSLHFALPRTAGDLDEDLEGVAKAVPSVFRTWSEIFPNWSAYAQLRSSTPPQGVSL